MSKKGYAHQQGLKKDPAKKAKVFLGIPGAKWHGDFGMSLITMVAAANAQPFEGYKEVEIGIQNSKGSILPQLRQKLVDGAQEAGATHILFIDTDMVFPPFTLHELLQHDKDIVACNCPVKTLPSNPTARFLPTPDHPTGIPVFQENFLEREDPLLKVWRVGTGIMLIKMEVFQNISYPNFPIRYDVDTDVFVGEDWGFCELAEAAGYDIYVDVHLSNAIQHVGDLSFHHGMVQTNDIPMEEHRIVLPD